jgi:hypothetical protein
MHPLKAILIIAVATLPLSALSGDQKVNQTENVRARIAENEFIVDICVYEMEWIPATPKFPKAKWLERAVVTGVYKGNIAIGTKLEYCHLIEEPPRLFNWRFRTVVEGDLLTFFFSKGDGTLKGGKYTLEGDRHFQFPRCEGDFAEAFQKELKTNPALQGRSEAMDANRSSSSQTPANTTQ